MLRRPGYRAKAVVWIVSVILGEFIGLLIPTSKSANGGTAKLILILFFMVLFRTVIEYFLDKSQKEKW
ncbi:MAG TPA: hypothetical protein VK731_10240 [Candidatus Cybelea sp.]|jgi:hypothetical protein|nr:hypothetical protein [Candidatus Cybelea sp.]